MGTCKLRAGDRREPVIGYRSMGAEASSAGDGLSNPRGDARTKGGGWNRVRDRVGARDPPPCPAEGSGGCAARSWGRVGAPRDAPSSLGVRSWGGPGLNQRGQGGSARSFPSPTPRGGGRKPQKPPLRHPHPLRARGMLVPWPAPARGRGEELGARFPTSLLELVPGAPQASSSRSHFNSGQTFLLFAPAPPRRRLRLRLVAPGEFLRIQDVEDGEGGDPMRGVGGLLGPSVQALRHPPLLSALLGGGDPEPPPPSPPPPAAAGGALEPRSESSGEEKPGGGAGGGVGAEEGAEQPLASSPEPPSPPPSSAGAQRAPPSPAEGLRGERGEPRARGRPPLSPRGSRRGWGKGESPSG